ncbi:unnamed protein product [Effrenium voratum]|nr:unnamed protein product [Effrenium voratum]
MLLPKLRSACQPGMSFWMQRRHFFPVRSMMGKSSDARYWALVGVSSFSYAGACYFFFYHTQAFGHGYYQRLRAQVTSSSVHQRLQNELQLSGVVAALMTTAAFSSFRQPPVAPQNIPRLPQLCGCFMGLGMTLNFFALIVALHMQMKLNEYEDGAEFLRMHETVLPLHKRLLFAGGLALCLGKVALSFALYKAPAALLTAASLTSGGFALAWLIRDMYRRECLESFRFSGTGPVRSAASLSDSISSPHTRYWALVGVSSLSYAGAWYRCKDGPPRAQEVHGRMQNELELSGVVAAVMTSAAFSSFREPPVPSKTMPRLPQLCGSPVAGFMGLGMTLNFFALIVALHMQLTRPWQVRQMKLNEYEDGAEFLRVHERTVLPLHRRLLFAGGLALCLGKVALSFTLYEAPAALLTEISRLTWIRPPADIASSCAQEVVAGPHRMECIDRCPSQLVQSRVGPDLCNL